MAMVNDTIRADVRTVYPYHFEKIIVMEKLMQIDMRDETGS
jgi:hypothetical protein